jgi:hypothetical protein
MRNNNVQESFKLAFDEMRKNHIIHIPKPKISVGSLTNEGYALLHQALLELDITWVVVVQPHVDSDRTELFTK